MVPGRSDKAKYFGFYAGAEKVRCLVVISCFESINHVWATVWSQIVPGDASFFRLHGCSQNRRSSVILSVLVILALLCLDEVSYYHIWSSVLVRVKAAAADSVYSHSHAVKRLTFSLHGNQHFF